MSDTTERTARGARRRPARGGAAIRRRRCASSPVPVPARPECSPDASPTRAQSRPSTPAECWRSRSPARRPASSTPGCAASACATRSPRAPSTASRTRSCGATGPTRTAPLPGCSTARFGRRARPATRTRRHGGARRHQRDRVGQSARRQPRRLRGGRTAADRRPSASLALMAEVYRRYEQEKKERRVVDFDDLLSLCRRAPRDRHRVRFRATVALPPRVRRRVPRRQPFAVHVAEGVARIVGRPVRGRRPPTGHLFVERRRRRLPRRLRPTLPRRGQRRAAQQLPLDPAGDGRRAGGAAGRVDVGRHRRDQSRRSLATRQGVPERHRRSRGIARAVRDAHDPGKRGPTKPCSCAPTGRSRCSKTRCARPRSRFAHAAADCCACPMPARSSAASSVLRSRSRHRSPICRNPTTTMHPDPRTHQTRPTHDA